MRRVVRLGALLFMVLAAACAEPPEKEMHQAQGAIDAARAAGADRFAADELGAATDALARAGAAVADGDYRQALGHALDSRERAQNAARMAVEGRANARGAAERAITEVATLLSRAEAQIDASDRGRAARRALREPLQTIATAREDLQEARSALEKEDYAGVDRSLGDSAARLRAALGQIDKTTSPPPARRVR